MRRRLVALILTSSLLVGCGGGEGEPDLEVGQAQAAVPVAGSSQVVVTIRNEGDGPDTLVEAETDAAVGVEIHRTELEDGRASMNQLTDIEIPAGEQLRFRPGDLHLMLVVPRDEVVDGGTFDLTLRFERTGDVTIPVEVTELLDLYEDGLEDPDAPADPEDTPDDPDADVPDPDADDADPDGVDADGR